MKICPACKKESLSEEECTHCGIFFVKWEALHPSGSAPANPPPPPLSSGPLAAVSETVGVNQPSDKSSVEPNIGLVPLLIESLQTLAKAPGQFFGLAVMPFIPAVLMTFVATRQLQSMPFNPMAVLMLGKHLIWLIPLTLFLLPYGLFSVIGVAHGIVHQRKNALADVLSASFGYFPKYFAALLIYAALTTGIYFELFAALVPRALLVGAGKSIEANMYVIALAPLYLFGLNFLIGTSLFGQMFYLNSECGSLQSLYESYVHFPDMAAKLRYAGFLIVISLFTGIISRAIFRGMLSGPALVPAILLALVNITSCLLVLLGGTVWAASYHNSNSTPLLK